MNFVTIDTRTFFSIPNLVPERKHRCGTKFVLQLSGLLQKIFVDDIAFESLITKKKAPFIIGINGSVSSGKSHLSKELQNVLQCFNPSLKVSLLSTDNFIFSNKKLTSKKIMHLKGEPSSYDWKLLFKILKKIKQNKAVSMPYYSQLLGDIHPRRKISFPSHVDILIVEGINLLKTTCEKFLLSDYLDFSIYIDTPERNLRDWFYKRLLRKKTIWKKRGIKRNLTRKNKRDFEKFAKKIWNDYNAPNLERNIYPYRVRADLVLVKNKRHVFTELAFKI